MSQLCLPEGFEIDSKFETEALFSIEDPGDEPNIFIHFRKLSETGAERILSLSDAYVLGRSESIDEVSLSEYIVDPEQANLPWIDIYVIEVEGLYALQITASETTEIEELARELANQWAASTSNQVNIESARKDPLREAFRQIPYFSNGVMRGYRVYPGLNRELFFSLGMRPGDLLTVVNEQNIKDADIFSEFLDLLASGETVRLTIERRGELEEIEIRIPDDPE